MSAPTNVPRIVIGIPSSHSVHIKTLRALSEMELPDDYQVGFLYVDCSVVYAARGTVTDVFLENADNHYLLFCDSDMTPPRHALKTLLSRDVDIAAALCCKREPPYRPVIVHSCTEKGDPVEMQTGQIPMSGLHPVWGSGLAFSLIKRHVLERVKGEMGPHTFFHERMSNGDVMGEDITFFWKANKLGFKTYLDADVHVGHISDYPIYPADAARWYGYSGGQIQEQNKLRNRIGQLEAELAALKTAPAKVSFPIVEVPVPAPA